MSSGGGARSLDALLISTPKHKADQEGAKCFARHLYANPTNPFICPVLALAVAVFTRCTKHDPTQSSNSTAPPNYRIFDGNRSESRFSEALVRAIASLSDEDLTKIGGKKEDIGTHSVRKGAASHCTGMMNGPSAVQIFLRAGWSLGAVQDRYLFAGAGGDQLTGRVLSGLPFNHADFTSLPPHFDRVGLALVRWQTVLPIYDRLPETFKRALPYLLASICYHHNWLRGNLKPDHPLFASYLFASISFDELQSLKSHIFAGHSRCSKTDMHATGIPTHLVISHAVIGVTEQTKILRDELIAKCKELPNELTSALLSKFSINGAIPVTMDDMTALMNSLVTQMRAEMRSAATATVLPTSSTLVPLEPTADPRFNLWMWKGRMHMVPEGWLFPSTTMKETWNLWHFGHVQDRVRPLRYLKKVDLQSDTQVTLWSKTAGVMGVLADTMVAMDMAAAAEDVTKWSADESSVAFDNAVVRLIEEVDEGATHGRGRWMEMTIGTVYKKLKHRLGDRRKERKRKREQARPSARRRVASNVLPSAESDEADSNRQRVE